MDLKTLCLGAFAHGDAPGHDVRKQFDRGPFSHCRDAGHGSVYPVLKDLLGKGLVTRAGAARDARPELEPVP